jgi:glycosyltransferase involved in cell wall biosynthesis
VLRHGETAILFEPDSLPGFVRSLQLVCADRALRDRLGAAARAVVAEKYTWHANVAQVLDAMNSCVSGQ